MLSLPDLQRRMADSLFADDGESAARWVHDDGIDPQARLGIYRNNLRQGFTKTLALEFPVIERLVGADYFRQLAHTFLARHPSRSGDLHHIGAPFAAFLGERFAGTRYTYFADVAALEWACQECWVAPESESLDPAALRAVPPHAYATLRFTLSPACRLVHSAYPVIRIWEVNRDVHARADTIDLDSGGDFVLVRRAAGRLDVHRVTQVDFQLLAALAAGESLEAGLINALACEAQFDLGAALRRCFALGVFCQMTYDPSVPKESVP
jgi:hypothetical protein